MRYRLRVATWIVVREPGQPSPRALDGPLAVALLAQDLVKDADDDREHFWSIPVNGQLHFLLAHLVSIGTQSSTSVHPREVFGPALREGAAGVILAHHHPSGDPTPSREDIRLTLQLRDAAALLNLGLHDHVIVGSGSGRWVSMAKRKRSGRREVREDRGALIMPVVALKLADPKGLRPAQLAQADDTGDRAAGLETACSSSLPK